MCDTPVDQKLKNGLKVQAKLISIAIIHSLIEANHKPIPNDKVKNLADVIYTSQEENLASQNNRIIYKIRCLE